MESGPIDPAKGRQRGASLRPGVVVGGKFVLIRQIGHGAVGAIFEAEDTWIGRRVALKVLHPHVARHPDVMWRFRREARAAASIEHPNIVSVLEVGQRRDGTYYIVQELLDGISLRRHLEENGRLPVEEALDILVPIMGALVASHRKDIIHRDIKPENILLANDRMGEVTPKLIDFGIARMHGQKGELDTEVGVLLGTPSYMSPEQAEGAPVDAGTDIWAVGAVMYELLSGTRPFLAASAALVVEKIRSESPPRITAVAPGLPAEIADVVHQALERDPELRFSSMQAFLRAVLDYVNTVDPGFAARHARSIPRYVGAGLVGPARGELDSDASVDEDVRTPVGRLFPSVAPVVRPDLEWHEDLPPAPVRGLDAYAETALSVNALDDAIALAEQALVAHREGGAGGDDVVGRMRLVQAIAYRWLGHFAEAERCARAAIVELPRGSAGWYTACGHLAMAVGYLGKSDALADLAVELADMEPGGRAIGAHVRALCQVVVFLIRAGLVGLAERLFGIARNMTGDLPYGEPGVRAWLDQASAELALHGGDPTTFLRYVESAVEGFAESGDARNASLQRANIGNAYMQLGAFARAERVLRQVIAVAQPMKLSFLAPVKANLGHALARLGQVEEALAVETEAVHRCVEQGYRRFEAASRIYLAEIHSMRGDLWEAEAEARRAESASSGAPAIRAHALATHASILLASGEPEAALTRADEAMHILESLDGVEEGEALIRLVHIRALEACGRFGEADLAIVAAQSRVRVRAERISDPRYRKSFLQNVPENAATLALSVGSAAHAAPPALLPAPAPAPADD
jgi:serine/threonine protein kinase/tetratricopeptide (TPR) repeat protein